MRHTRFQQKGRSSLGLGARHLPLLLAFGCLTLPLTSAYASGPNSLPPVVVHPMQHSSAPPVLHSLVNTNNLNSSTPGSGQSGMKSSSSNANINQHGQAGSSVGKSQAGQLNHGVNNFSAGSQGGLNQTSAGGAASKTSSLPSGGYELDLSSTKANIVLGSNIFTSTPSVTINVGGTATTFSPGQKVTAAEYVAIQQQLANNNQSLVLNARGAADGGKFTLNSAVNSKVTELVVPGGVTGLDLLSKNSSLTIAGDVENYGSIYGVSTNKLVTSGTLSAADITNESGGIISTVLPASLASAIANTAPNVSLTLNATNSINNSGTISGSGGLTLATVHGAISNNSGGVVTANNDINLSVGSGSLTNTGLVASTNGNININSAAGTDLNINAQGGTFQAASNINLREPAYSGNNNITLNGGNYLSNNLNIFAGSGVITGNVGSVTGALNTAAGVEHFNAGSQNLILGSNTITGDPTFVNTGSITISGTNTFSENVAIIANGDVLVSNAGQIIDPGNNVTIIAGVAETGGNNPVGTISGSPGTGSSTNVTVDFSSASNNGGNINLQGGASDIIDTSNSGGNGGSVTLAAFANGTTGGMVLLDTTSTINTYGGGTGSGGAVNIFAGANPATNTVTVQFGNIVTCGAPGGNINIQTAQPTATGGTTVQFDTHGNIVQGGPITASSTISPYAQVAAGVLATCGAGGAGAAPAPAMVSATPGGNGGAISIQAGSFIADSLLTFGGGGGGGATSSSDGANGGAGGAVTVTANGGTITAQLINSSGGGGGGWITHATAGGQAGQVTVTAAPSAQSMITLGQVEAVDGAGGGQAAAGSGGGGGGGSLGGAGGGAGGTGNGGGGGGGGGGGTFDIVNANPGGGGGGSGDTNGHSGGGGSGGGFAGGSGGAAGGTGAAGQSSSTSGFGATGGAGSGGSGGAGGNIGLGGSGGGGTGTGQLGLSIPLAQGIAGVNTSNMTLSYGTVTDGHDQPLLLNASGTGSSNGGSVTYTTYGSANSFTLNVGTLVNDLEIIATSGPSGGNGGSASIGTAGTSDFCTFVINPSAIVLGPIGTNGNGGSLSLANYATAIQSSSGLPLLLTENGVGSGNGGSISIRSFGAPVVIGNTTGSMQLVARSGATGSVGGSISVLAPTLTVDPSQLSVSAFGTNATGGSITLNASTMTINGSLNVSGTGSGSGGSISLTSEISEIGAPPFVVGMASSNGISGSLISPPGASSSITIGTGTYSSINIYVPITATNVTIQSGNNLYIDAPITASTASLTASGYIMNVNPGIGVSASSLTLQSTHGLIGEVSSPLTVSAPSITLFPAGFNLAYVTNYANGGQSLDIPSSAAAIYYTGTGNITLQNGSGAVADLNIVSTALQAGTAAGNIIVNQPITTSSQTAVVSLITAGGASITEGPSGGISAGTIDLQTGSGSIGAAGAPIQINASGLTKAATLSFLTTGLVNVNVANAAYGVDITQASSQSSFTLSAPGSFIYLTATGLQSVKFLSLTSGYEFINANVGGSATTGGVTLISNGLEGDMGTINGTGILSGGPMVLTSSQGSIYLTVLTNNLTVTAAGAVNIANISKQGGFTLNNSSAGTSFGLTYAGPGPWTVDNVAASSGNVGLSGTGSLTIGRVSAGGNITVGDALNGSNGNITVNGNITTVSGVAGISTTGAGTISESGSVSIQGATVNLASGTGAIGSIAVPIAINATNLSALTSGLVDVNNTGTGGITLTNANTTSGFVLTSQSQINIHTAGLSNAEAIVLQAQANNGGVAINNVNVGGSATAGGVTVSAQGSGQITETGSGTLIGGPMSLTAGTGGMFLNLYTSNVTTNSGGIVSLGDLSTGTVTVGSSTASTFSLGSNGSITLNNLSATNGYVNVLGAGSLVQVVPNAAISANNGSLNLENANTSSGSIVIGAGDFIHTIGTGNALPVNITIGAIPTNPIVGPTPSNVTVIENGGTVYFGTNGISVPGTGVTLSLQGSNIVFNTGSRPASAITVNANSTIIADPIPSVNSGLGSGTESGATRSLQAVEGFEHGWLTSSGVPTAGSITETYYFNQITATNLNIEGGSSNIGLITSANIPFFANANQLSILSTGIINFQDNAGPVTLTGANTSNAFILSCPNSPLTVSTAGLTSAAAIGLYAGGTLTLNNPIGGAATTGGVSLQGTTIQEPTGAPVSGAVRIVSGNAYLNINSQSLAVGGNGTVSIGNYSTGSLVVGNSTASSFSLGSNGSVFLNNLSASNGYINVLAAGSLLQVQPGSLISATNGSLNLQNANTTSGSIVIGGSSLLETAGSGSALPVDITIGAIPQNPIAGPSPNNVQFLFSGGSPYFGANGISVPAPTVTLSLQGSNIVFNTGSRPASAITVEANTVIVADPVRESFTPNLFVPASLEVAPPVLTSKGTAVPSLTGQFPTRITDTSNTPVPQVSLAFPGDRVSSLAGDSGQVAAINGENVASVLGLSASNIGVVGTMNASSQAVDSTTSTNAATALQPSMNVPSNYWISDTELITGKIPAVLFSDEFMDITPDVSTVVELEEQDPGAIEGASGTTTLKPGAPLLGSVSRTAHGVKVLKLNRGSVLFAPSLDTVVRTPFGEVKIDANSVALVMAFQHGLAVFDLHDVHGRALVVQAAGKEVVLAPGMQATITNSTVKSFEHINPAQLFGYGMLKERSLGKD